MNCFRRRDLWIKLRDCCSHYSSTNRVQSCLNIERIVLQPIRHFSCNKFICSTHTNKFGRGLLVHCSNKHFSQLKPASPGCEQLAIIRVFSSNAENKVITGNEKLLLSNKPCLKEKHDDLNCSPRTGGGFSSFTNKPGDKNEIVDNKLSEEEDEKSKSLEKLTLFQKFKVMYRDYWYVLIPVHFATSVVWFGGFYVAAKSGVDIISVLEFLRVSDIVIDQIRNGGHAKQAGLLAVSFALYKIATPVRYAVTLGGTTLAINHLKKFGYIKPMPKKEKLKEMYLEQKEQLKSKVNEIQKGYTMKETNNESSDTKNTLKKKVK